jgi:hypothetical protein
MASDGWFHVKMTLVLILLALQILMAGGRLRGAWVTPVVGAVALGAIFLARTKPF